MEKKITKKERFEQLLTIEAIATNKELVGFIKHEIELLSNKKSSGKLTKTQEENLALKGEILKALEQHSPTVVTVTDLCQSVFTGYTNQKISSMLRQLIEEGKVIKTVEKKVSYFTSAPVETETEVE